MRIPFNKPFIGSLEYDYLCEAIDSDHISGNGLFTKRCEAELEKQLGARVLLTTSCTHALEMAAILLDIQPGDEVIVPSFTFVSTVNAFVMRGARPVFCDIRRDTLNIDETQIQRFITPRTKAIVVVHYAGIACELDAILEIARAHDIPVVEDNAHGLFGSYKGEPLGSFGTFVTLSFHETKNITCGEGGALVINSPKYVDRAEIIRDKGTNRREFDNGQVDKYTWQDLGSSYAPSDLLAAVLCAQLEKWAKIRTARAQLWYQYFTCLQPWAESQGVTLPTVPDHCEQSFHMFYMLCPSKEFRNGLIQFLKGCHVQAVFHYTPLHSSPMGLKLATPPVPRRRDPAVGPRGLDAVPRIFCEYCTSCALPGLNVCLDHIHFGERPDSAAQFEGGVSPTQKDTCPNSTWASDHIIRLPFYTGMTSEEQSAVIEAVTSFKGEGC